jgi:hypothetical protein
MGHPLNSRSRVNKLLFPVKLARLALLLITSQSLSCGYRAAYGGSRPTQRLSVTVAASRVAHAEVVDAVVAGAREELSRAGVLKSGQAHPRLLIEVLRVDEWPDGISALPTAAGSSELAPSARGTSVGVVGRAWVVEGPGGSPMRPTGDVRRVDRYAVARDPGQDAIQFVSAARSAARKLGIALARRVLGEPTPTVEPL